MKPYTPDEYKKTVKPAKKSELKPAKTVRRDLQYPINNKMTGIPKKSN